MSTKPSHALTMRDRMSHLSFEGACKLLGPQGKRLLLEGGALELEAPEDLRVDEREAVVVWDKSDTIRKATARLVLDPASRVQLRATCTSCDGACAHLGGLLAYVLENKSGLGLAEPPPETELKTFGDDDALVEAAIAERRDRSKAERMSIRSQDETRPWTDYAVTNLLSGKTYRVVLRGEERGISYCSCPDFKKNTLGTCKHVMKVLARAKKRFPASVLRKPYRRTRITVHLRYDTGPSLAIALPGQIDAGARAIVEPLLAAPIEARGLLECLRKLEALGQPLFVTPDAEAFIDRALEGERLAGIAAEIRAAPDKHPLRTELLATPLLPYQLDGIAFAVGAGRAILADDMGLGKTIQGVGVAEILAREANVRKVLVVCPASLKSQWRAEIRRFSGRSVGIVLGAAKDRAKIYAGSNQFFTICNYEQVIKDILHIERTPWDLVILDEGQRIKNWEAKTSRVIKGLASRFALVLSGTPLENRLDDLHSVVEFVDPHALGPTFRFFHRHRQLDEDGKLVGYKNLDELRERLRPILLRRTRESVRLELPERTTEIVRIAPTAQQKELHDAHMKTVAQIVRKPFLTEMDLLRLRMALLMCRMAANGTFLVDKVAPGWSTKLERLDGLLEEIAGEVDRKVVLFSEWTTMLDLVEPLLRKHKLDFVRLDGSVPQRQRAEIVARFQSDARTRVFLSTNAGSTGLNLQAANTIINVELPWNPAVLEQRIGRAHRMGQARQVSVFLLVTEDTLEENLLATLSSKRELALAALDAESTVSEVDVRTGAEDLKRKLEILLGARPEAPVDRVAMERAEVAPSLADAGKILVRAALSFLNELGQTSGGRDAGVGAVLDAKVEAGEGDRRRLSIALPSNDEIETLAQGLARLLGGLAAKQPSASRAAESPPAN